MRVRKRVEQDVPDDAVDDGDGADAERQRDDGDRREARRPAQHARRVAHVPARVVEPEERARVTLHRLGLIDPAELAPRRQARLFGAHAARAIVVFEQAQVRVDFPGQFPFGPVWPEDVVEPQQEAPESRHGQASSTRSLSTKLTSRRQRSACFSSARAPGFVMR